MAAILSRPQCVNTDLLWTKCLRWLLQPRPRQCACAKRPFPLTFSSQTGMIKLHYSDVIMGAMAHQITSLTIVYSTVYSGTVQRKHQSAASLAFVTVIHRWPVNSSHKRASNWENVSIWWRHHGLDIFIQLKMFLSYQVSIPTYMIKWFGEVVNSLMLYPWSRTYATITFVRN